MDSSTKPPSNRVSQRLHSVRMVQNFHLVWLDGNIDETNDDFRDSITKLREVVNTVNTFVDVDECIDFINGIKEEKAFMISSDALGKTTVPMVHDKPQVNTIYIFCENKEHHEKWAKEWPKVAGVYTDITPICEALKQAAHDCDHNSVSINFVKNTDGAPNQSLDTLDSSFVYTQILKEILLTIDFDQGHIKEFLTYCREQFAGNYAELKNVDKIGTEYRSDQSIWWYTYDYFLYSMLNRALRTMEVNLITMMGFFVRDLHEHIAALHSEQYGGQSHSNSFIVYRGQGLSQADFDHLQTTQGGLLAFNNFLSTNLHREVSLQFARRTIDTSDKVGALLVMKIDPSISATPFANVKNDSYFQEEEEILFSMHSVFRIAQVKQIEKNNNRLWQVDLTLTGDHDPQLQELTKSMRDDTEGPTGWFRLGRLMMKVAQYDKAQKVFEMILDRTTDEKETGDIYYYLGWIKMDQGKYPEAITHYEKSLKIYQKTLPANHPNLANSYACHGSVYDKMGEYSKALSYYEKAFEIQQKTLPANHPDLAQSYSNIGGVCKNMGEYSKALSSHEKALEIQQKTLPANHPNLANSYSNIGGVYKNMGEYSKALSSHEKALEIRQKILPANHPDLAASYSNIGGVYYNMGEYSKARSYYGKGLEIDQKTLPANHPDLATSYNNIGGVYYNMGEYSKAFSYYEKALEIRQQILPPNHPDLATSYNNIGTGYYNMGEYSKALSSHEKALEIRRKTLPANHPDLATSYNNIGGVYQNMGEYSKALSSHEKALEIRQKTLPANHPDLATSYNNIGGVYYNMGEYSKTLSYYEKALEIDQKTLPANHPELAASYSNIGGVYYNMGEHSKARSYYEKALEIDQKTFPANHPDLATSYNNIGTGYYNMGEYSKALSYYEKALEIRQQTLPANHPDLATSYNNIGTGYHNMGEYSKALSYYEKAFEIQQKILPPNHPDLATSYRNIGLVYDKMGEYSKALSSHEKALEIRQKTLPANHPDLATSYNNIGTVYDKMGEYSKAHSSHEKALEIRQKTLPAEHPDLATPCDNIGSVHDKLTGALLERENAMIRMKIDYPIETDVTSGSNEKDDVKKPTEPVENTDTKVIPYFNLTTRIRQPNSAAMEYSFIYLLTEADASNELKRISDKPRIFLKPYECLSEIVKAVHQKLVLIVSQSLLKNFVPLIHDLIQVIYIYILHKYDTYHEYETENYVNDKRYPKIRGSFAEQTMLIFKLNDDLQQLANIPLRQPDNMVGIETNIDFYVISEQSSSLKLITAKEQDFISFQLIIKTILESSSTNPLNHPSTSLELCRLFPNNDEQKHLWDTDENFHENYVSEKAFSFYLSNASLKNELNTCFHNKNIRKICKFWFFIRDLMKNLPVSKKLITVYRGQYLTTDQIQILKSNIGGFMTFTKFFSMSTSNIRAIRRSGENSLSTQLNSVVFQLEIDNGDTNTRFLMIKESYEEQIFLFAAGSIFRIESVEQLNDKIWCCKLSVNSDDKSELTRIFQYYETEIGTPLTYLSLGVYLNEIGEDDLARQYYDTLLMVTTDPDIISSIYNNLAIIFEHINELTSAQKYWDLASKLKKQNTLKTSTPLFDQKLDVVMADPISGVSPILNYYNLAYAYQQAEDFNEALEECEKALELSKNIASDPTHIALIYSAMGGVYYSQKKYEDALKSFEMALDIALIYLTATDPLIDQYLNNVGILKNIINEKDS